MTKVDEAVERLERRLQTFTDTIDGKERRSSHTPVRGDDVALILSALKVRTSALEPFDNAVCEARNRYPEAGSAYLREEACSHLSLSDFETASTALTDEASHEG